MRPVTMAACVFVGAMLLAGSAAGDARQKCSQGDEPQARIAACTELIRSGEHAGRNLAIAYNNRGTARDELGEHSAAIEDYDAALRIDPDYAAAHYNRGRAHDELGAYRAAIADYDAALRIEPEFANAYQNRGVSHEKLDEPEMAQRDWARAIELAGEARARWWQEYLKAKGHYSGPIDGIYGPGTERGLLACARDPDC